MLKVAIQEIVDGDTGEILSVKIRCAEGMTPEEAAIVVLVQPGESIGACVRALVEKVRELREAQDEADLDWSDAT